ncbi:MAG: hypothetical protein UMR38_06630 [Candidatus Izemoplasma sp.]|nr:hypothetical protein [Candidatus Izemoplasma sp.]
MPKPSLTYALTKAFQRFIPLVIVYAIMVMLEELNTPYKPIFDDINTVIEWLLTPVLAVLIGYYLDRTKSLIPNLLVGALAGVYGTTFLGGLLVALSYHILYTRLKHVFKIEGLPLQLIVTVLQLVLFYVVMIPAILSLLQGLNSFLSSMANYGVVILVMILAGFTALDLGGPFNKAAFSFTMTAFLEGEYHIAGPVLLTTGIPVLAMGVIHLFHPAFKEAYLLGHPLKTLVLGIVGLSEGALPYAAKKPLPVILSGVIGCMIAAMTAALLGVTNTLFISSVIGVVGSNKPILWLMSIDIGIITTIISYYLLHIIQRKKES